MTNKTPRAFEVREQTKQPEVWTPKPKGGVLGIEDPNYSFKWVNLDVQGDSGICDRMWLDRMDTGWVPVNPEDYPEFKGRLSHLVKNGQVRRPGQILCKMPKHLAESRNEYFRNEDRKRRAVRIDADIQSPDPRISVSSSQSSRPAELLLQQ